MLIDHDHPPGRFDAGHCWVCAHQAGLLDHYDRVQDRKPTSARPGNGPGRPTGTPSGLGSSAVGVLLAAAALLTP
jgi:hypothetical protein